MMTALLMVLISSAELTHIETGAVPISIRTFPGCTLVLLHDRVSAPLGTDCSTSRNVIRLKETKQASVWFEPNSPRLLVKLDDSFLLLWTEVSTVRISMPVEPPPFDRDQPRWSALPSPLEMLAVLGFDVRQRELDGLISTTPDATARLIHSFRFIPSHLWPTPQVDAAVARTGTEGQRAFRDMLLASAHEDGALLWFSMHADEKNEAWKSALLSNFDSAWLQSALYVDALHDLNATALEPVVCGVLDAAYASSHALEHRDGDFRLMAALRLIHDKQVRCPTASQWVVAAALTSCVDTRLLNAARVNGPLPAEVVLKRKRLTYRTRFQGACTELPAGALETWVCAMPATVVGGVTDGCLISVDDAKKRITVSGR